MIHLRTWAAAVALMCAAAGLLAACGDDESDSSGDGESATLSRSEFQDLGYEICQSNPTGFERISETAGGVLPDPQATPAEWEEFIAGEYVPNLEQQIEELRELTPAQGEEELEEALASMEDGIAELEAAPPTSIESFFNAQITIFAEANRQIALAGLPPCAA